MEILVKGKNYVMVTLVGVSLPCNELVVAVHHDAFLCRSLRDGYGLMINQPAMCLAFRKGLSSLLLISKASQSDRR